MIRLTKHNGREVYVNPAQVLWLGGYTHKESGKENAQTFIAFAGNESDLYVCETPGEVVQMIHAAK